MFSVLCLHDSRAQAECDTHEELATRQCSLEGKEGCQQMTVGDRKAVAAKYATDSTLLLMPVTQTDREEGVWPSR